MSGSTGERAWGGGAAAPARHRQRCRAVFLDRDGVLNSVVYRNGTPASPRTIAEVERVAGTAREVARLRAADFRIFVVSNQPDVARGLMSRTAHDAITARVLDGVAVDDVRSCTHDDADLCACRKPRPGMLYELSAVWNVDLYASYMVGDSWKDMAAGRAAGCTTVLLRRAYNQNAEADHEAASLADAVDLILHDGGRSDAVAEIT